MTKISKKEIRLSVEEAVKQTLSKYNVPALSKKTEKIMDRLSRKLAGTVKETLKKEQKKDKSRERVRTKKQKATKVNA